MMFDQKEKSRSSEAQEEKVNSREESPATKTFTVILHGKIKTFPIARESSGHVRDAVPGDSMEGGLRQD